MAFFSVQLTRRRHLCSISRRLDGTTPTKVFSMDRSIVDEPGEVAQPIDVDQLFKARSELFPHSLPSIEKRRSVFVGEMVKIVVGVREAEQLVDGRWLIVESISVTEAGLRATGRGGSPFSDDGRCFTFGPEHIYRMEPRHFYVWGSGGLPVALRAGDGPDNRTPAPPWDAHERPVSHGSEIIVEFAAAGRRGAEAHYRLLAAKNVNWPAYDELK